MNFTDEEILTCSATKGDLLVCEGGAGYGRSAIWDKDFDICLQNHVHRLRPVVSGVCEYVYYFIYLLKQSNQLLSVGTAMPGLSANRLKSIIIPVPPIEEQTRIVSRIDHLMKIIERFEQSIMKLDELEDELRPLLKKSILQYAIQGKLVPQNPSDEPASILLDSIRKEKEQLLKTGRLKKKDITDSIIFKGEDNKYYEQIGSNTTLINDDILFDIPDSWIWTTIGNVLQVQTGASFKKEDAGNKGVRILRGGNIVAGTYVFKEDDIFISQDLVSEGILLRRNDLITPAVTSIENVGKIARIKEDHHMISAGGFVFILRPFLQDDVLSQYLCYLIKSPVIIERIKAITKKSGSAFYNIGKERLIKIHIPIPPYKEMCRIVAILKDLIKSIEG